MFLASEDSLPVDILYGIYDPNKMTQRKLYGD